MVAAAAAAMSHHRRLKTDLQEFAVPIVQPKMVVGVDPPLGPLIGASLTVSFYHDLIITIKIIDLVIVNNNKKKKKKKKKKTCPIVDFAIWVRWIHAFSKGFSAKCNSNSLF